VVEGSFKIILFVECKIARTCARETDNLVVFCSGRALTSLVLACIVFIYMKIFVCFVQQACLLPARACDLGGICQCIQKK
jgi:hypothetical protein